MISARRNLLTFALGALIVVSTLVAYIPGMRGDFIWDDDANITANPNMRTLEGLKETWVNPRANQQYYPVTHTSFWIEYQIWGLKPFPFHVTNVLLHSVSAILLWVLLRRLRVPGAWFAAGIFALHPVHAESVAWITERKNNLSVMFYLASMLAYVRFAGLDEGEGGGEWVAKWRIYLVSFVFFVLAFLAKSVTVTLPIALGIITWWKRGRLSFRDVIYLAPMVMLGAGMGWLTEHLEQHHVGALGWEWEIPFLAKVIVAGRSCWFFVGKLLWPSNLIFVYPKWKVDPGELWQYVYPVGAVAVVVLLYILRGRIGRGPLTAVLYYGVTLSPAFSFLNVFFMRYSYVQDHFVYPASIGIITLVAALVTVGLRTAFSGDVARYVIPAVYGIVLAALGVLLWQHCHIYENNVVLWNDTLSKNPTAWMAHNNLGNEVLREGRIEEAIRRYKTAIRLAPKQPVIYYNLGTVYAKQGRIRDAEMQFRQALRLWPEYPDAHANLAVVLAAQGKDDEAYEHYKAALKYDPRHANAHYNFATLLANRGQIQEAIKHYEIALRINPWFAPGHVNLADILASQGRKQEAIKHYLKALELEPCLGKVHLALGSLFLNEGQTDKAIEHLRTGLRLEHKDAMGHYNLAVAYYVVGRYADAWKELDKSIQLGISPNPAFVRELSRAMPKPRP